MSIFFFHRKSIMWAALFSHCITQNIFFLLSFMVLTAGHSGYIWSDKRKSGNKSLGTVALEGLRVKHSNYFSN